MVNISPCFDCSTYISNIYMFIMAYYLILDVPQLSKLLQTEKKLLTHPGSIYLADLQDQLTHSKILHVQCVLMN